MVGTPDADGAETQSEDAGMSEAQTKHWRERSTHAALA